MFSGGALVDSLARAWRISRTRFFWMVVGFLAENPLVVYQIMLLVLTLDVWALLLIPVAAALGHLVINVCFMQAWLVDASRMLESVRSGSFAGAQVVPLQPRAVLNSVNTLPYDLAEDIDRWLLRMNGFFSARMDETIRLFLVRGGGRNATYVAGPGFASYVFISSLPRPGTRSVIQKFYLLHEILHTSAEARLTMLERSCVPILLSLAVWAVFSIPQGAALVLLAVAWLVILVACSWESRRSRLRHKVDREIIADYLALGYLSGEERDVVRQVLANAAVPFLHDLTLSSEANRVRQEAFAKHLTGADEPAVEPAWSELRSGRLARVAIVGLALALAIASEAQSVMFFLAAVILTLLAFAALVLIFVV